MNKTNCLIQFYNNPLKVYYVGQLLKGIAILSLYKTKIVRGIYVKIEGKAYCEWTTGTGDNKETHTGEELYFSEKSYFIGGSEGEITVHPGVYNYTFQCNLPAKLPTSVEGGSGYIRYTVLVNLDRPRWPDQSFTEAFTVIRPLDLNLLPSLRDSIDMYKKFNFNLLCCCCFCCLSSDIKVYGQIPISGYSPGQKIFVQVKYVNTSREDLRAYLQIIKKIEYLTYKNSSRKHFEDIIVAEKKLGNCYAGKTIRFFQIILVPVVPPTDTTSCNIIKVHYVIRILGKCNVMCQQDPKLDIPITIGTYPLMVQAIRNQIVHNNRTYSNRPSTSTGINNEDFDSELPTYAEAVGQQVDIAGGSRYKPHYIIHRENQTP